MTKTRYTAGFRTRPAAPRAAGLRDTSGTSTASGQSGAAAALPESHFDVVVENDRTMLKLKDRYAGLYTTGFISARGKDDSAGAGGGGSSLSEVWASLKANTDAYKDTLIDVAHIPSLAISKVTGLQDLLDAKADLASTLSGYGITDAYTSDEVDALLSAKADTGHKHSAADITSGVLSIDRIPTIPYSKTSGVQAALVSGTSIKTINGVSILGSGNIVTPDTTYTSKAAASGGADLSLVTTGEKYTWNAKQAAISDLSTIRSNAADGAAAYGWGDHSKAGYLKSIANLVINGTVYDGTSTVTITTPTYTLASFGITASAAELNCTKGVTSAIQTQLNAKANASALGTAASANSAGIFSSVQHSDYNNNQSELVTRSLLSYWNGAYDSSHHSNLAYCAKGAFGTFATKSSLAFSELTDRPTTIAGYGITDALGSWRLLSKQDYQCYIILLCRIGANTTIQTHTINGTFWTEAGGGRRYQAAHINLQCADWASGHNEYYGFTPFGMGTPPRLVTCTYNSSQYLAVTFENTQAVRVHFDGSSSNILFTPILYYTSNTQTVNNSEIYNSIANVQYNKIPLIPSDDTVYHTGNLTKSSIGLGNVENTAFYGRSTSVNGTAWNMAGTVNSPAFSIYAPTSAGTSGQVLLSTGGTPSWVNQTALAVGTSASLRPNRYPTSGTSNTAPLIWYSGQPRIGTAEGDAYRGSSSSHDLWSYPAGGTSETSTYANIQTLRLSWDRSKYWHDLFASPNGTYLWHRAVTNGTAGDWHRLVEETTSNRWNISITGKVNDFVTSATTIEASAQTSTGWYRVALVKTGGINDLFVYSNLTIRISGVWNAASSTQALLTFQARHTSCWLTQISGRCGTSVSKIRAVNTNTNHFYIDIYVPVVGSRVGISFEGLGTVETYAVPTLITETVTPAAEIVLDHISGVNLTSSNYSSYALPLTGGTLTGNLSLSTSSQIIAAGSGGRSMIYNGNNIAFKTYAGGWATSFYIKSTADAEIGDIAGAYGGVDTLYYYYYGGKYQSPYMVISPTGNVGIGTTAPTNKLHVAGVAYASTGIYSDGYVSARGVDSSSDERLKTDIKPLANALDYILGTKYRSFRWKEDGKPCIGVIAQEELGREHGYLVEKHNDCYSYNYAATTALLGAALQEEDDKVERLKARIAALEAELERLKYNS